MNLRKKKILAAKTLKTGKNRIIFVKPRLAEIKEAITKQDIRDLKESGAILIKEAGGQKKREKGKKRRGPGKIKKKVKTKKQDYMTMTRKLREHISKLKKQEKISKEDVEDIRKKIRNKVFRSKSHLKEYLGGLKK